MRKPINTSVPEELIQKIDQFVKTSKGSYKDRSHLVEQAVRLYLGEDLPLTETLSKAVGDQLTNSGTVSLYETSLFPRFSMNVREKKAIAEHATQLIGKRKTLFIDGGTTCIEFAKALAYQRKGLTIVTNSALICLELGHTSEHKAIGVGGDFDPSSASFIGCNSEDAIEQFYVDYGIFSTKGIFPSEGTFESNMGLLRVKQVVARHCAQVILLVDHTKFNQRSLCKVLDISEINTIVTDDQAPQEGVELLRSNGHDVQLVPVDMTKNGGAVNVN
jgi:DeoR/GlpR family transcriptional regulator of sugar metabolism